ncbi:GGNBP2 [Bugula neritina]|uniref:GGNBP2 n=1 Tax=Bugula neritina TaxID=10212 RepID=A0A7J7JE42_BUGNE|nr:GGNBP2 [Bugula neritina]
MPLVLEEKATMVLQFPDNCVNCGLGNNKKSDVERFVAKYLSLNVNERLAATTTDQSEIAEQLACLVPCVGCRKSVERMLEHLALSGNKTLDPMQITKTKGKRCQITLKKNYKEDPKLLFALFYVHGNKLRDFVTMIPRSKKNKRCQLHSLDTQKNKSTSNWVDLWALLSPECRDEVLKIEYEKLKEAMGVYLEKHRFCTECKNKVLHAHGLLKGDDGKSKDKSYCPAMYDGIKFSKKTMHLHIRNNVEFIASLIARAEPDLMGSRRERHAKTLDIAQEEVLTCLGSYLYARLNRLLQKIRLEEQTWQQLFYIGICCLRQNFEVVLEQKQGISQLELLCSEFELEEKNKEHKKELKRQKKKKSKQSKKNQDLALEFKLTSCDDCGSTRCSSTECDRIECGSLMSVDTGSKSSLCFLESTSSVTVDSECACTLPSTPLSSGDLQCSCDCKSASIQHSDTESGVGQSPTHRVDHPGCCTVKTGTSDYGYSSGPDSCASSSTSTTSTEPSSINDTITSDRHSSGYVYASQTGLDHSCSNISCDPETASINNSVPSSGNGLVKLAGKKLLAVVESSDSSQKTGQTQKQKQFHSTLQDMLELNEDADSSEFITEKEMEDFRANMPKVTKERLELRERLKENFRSCMIKRRACCSQTAEHCKC